MCIFCAAIPVAATAGVTLNNKQLQARREAEEAGVEKPELKPILKITGGVVFLLLIGSATYPTLTYLP